MIGLAGMYQHGSAIWINPAPYVDMKKMQQFLFSVDYKLTKNKYWYAIPLLLIDLSKSYTLHL